MFYKPQHAKYDVKAAMRRFRVQVIMLTMALLLALTAAIASAAINDQPGAGNPDVNPTEQCPPGQNKDSSVGGLKKCGADSAGHKWW